MPDERPLAGARQRAGRGLADLADLEQRQRGDGLALRVRGPFGERAHHGGDQPGFGGRRLEFLASHFMSAACTASRS